MNKDSQTIDALGGVTEVAKKLGFKLPQGASRVANWRRRGIPAKVKLDFPWLFLATTYTVQPEQKKAQ
jgi:hypothetical protein